MTQEELARLTCTLTDVAMGRQPADLVIRNGRWVCVQSGEIIPRTRYRGQGRADCLRRTGCLPHHRQRHSRHRRRRSLPGARLARCPHARRIGHAHRDRVRPGGRSRTARPACSSTRTRSPMFSGLRGVRLMVDEAACSRSTSGCRCLPACLPRPGLETPGASIGPAEVAEAMTWPGIIGLGEVMNFPGVFNWRREDARRDGSHAPARQSDRRALCLARPGLALPRLRGRRAAGRSRRHPPGRCRRPRPPGDEGHAALRLGLARCACTGAGRSPSWDSTRAISSSAPTIPIPQTLVDEGHVDRAVRQAISAGSSADHCHPDGDDQHRRTFRRVSARSA